MTARATAHCGQQGEGGVADFRLAAAASIDDDRCAEQQNRPPAATNFGSD